MGKRTDAMKRAIEKSREAKKGVAPVDPVPPVGLPDLPAGATARQLAVAVLKKPHLSRAEPVNHAVRLLDAELRRLAALTVRDLDAKPKVVVQPAKPRKKKPPKPDRSPDGRDRVFNKKGRLPDGSTFHANWDASQGLWSGRLAVTTEGGMQAFDGKSDGLFKLLSQLDDQYRATLTEGPSQ